jgi:hypothetical protein
MPLTVASRCWGLGAASFSTVPAQENQLVAIGIFNVHPERPANRCTVVAGKNYLCRRSSHSFTAIAHMLKGQYQISEDDFVAAWRLHAWRNLVMRPSIPQLLTGTVVVILLIAGFITQPKAAPFAAVAFLLFASLFWIGAPYRVGRQYRSYRSIQEPHAVEVFDDRLEFRSADDTSVLPWPKIFQWRQNARLILIYKEPFLYHLVPKSIAQAGFDVELLVCRLAEHVGPER